MCFCLEEVRLLLFNYSEFEKAFYWLIGWLVGRFVFISFLGGFVGFFYYDC